MIRLAYGNAFIEFDFSAYGKWTIIEPRQTLEKAADSALIIENALMNPYGTEDIYELALRKKAGNAVIIVNDITRPTPYRYMLPPIIRELNRAGIADASITLLVATGIHRSHSDTDNAFCFGEDICRRVNVVNHDCDQDLLTIGTLDNGIELKINRLAVETDLLITTGLVSLHYIAGFSGGRKSILPGIAARNAIEASHRLMNDNRACLANIKDNPVNDLMLQAAGLAGVDYIMNVVGTADRVYFAAAGHYNEAWRKVVEYCEQTSVVDIDMQADVVIASCGGYPKDINVYQAQKALDTALMAVKTGGTIILLAECREGLGEEIFTEWVKAASCPDDIKKRFHSQFELGGHKAFAICRILDQADILMISSLKDEEVEELYIRPMPDLHAALKYARDKHGQEMTIAIMPEAPKTAVRIKI